MKGVDTSLFRLQHDNPVVTLAVQTTDCGVLWLGQQVCVEAVQCCVRTCSTGRSGTCRAGPVWATAATGPASPWQWSPASPSTSPPRSTLSAASGQYT